MMSLFVNWNIDPVFFHIGSLEVRYYGLSWAICFGLGMWLFTTFIKREGYQDKVFDSIFWYATLSTIIGARLGHCLFYSPMSYLAEPWRILYIWEGGLASHGAALGLLLGLWMFSRKNKMPYLWSLDRIMVAVAVGGAFVRLGNLMNSEIYGIETARPWGFIFSRATPIAEVVPKHPTQIYEALCYFIIFGILYWLYFRRDMARRRPGFMFGLGLSLIFIARFFIEFIKNPQEDFENGMSLMMGQWLSIPFILLGIYAMVRALNREEVKVEKIPVKAPVKTPVKADQVTRKKKK